MLILCNIQVLVCITYSVYKSCATAPNLSNCLLSASFPSPQNKDARNHPHFMYDATRLRYVVFYLRIGMFVHCMYLVGYSEQACCVCMALSVGVAGCY